MLVSKIGNSRAFKNDIMRFFLISDFMINSSETTVLFTNDSRLTKSPKFLHKLYCEYSWNFRGETKVVKVKSFEM